MVTALTVLSLAVGGICLRLGRDPLELGSRLIMHARTSVRWLRREAWPAVKTVAPRYQERWDEIRREL